MTLFCRTPKSQRHRSSGNRMESLPPTHQNSTRFVLISCVTAERSRIPVLSGLWIRIPVSYIRACCAILRLILPTRHVFHSLSRGGRHLSTFNSSQGIKASSNAILRNQVRNLIVPRPYRTQSPYLLARKCKFRVPRLRIPVLISSLVQGVEKRRVFYIHFLLAATI